MKTVRRESKNCAARISERSQTADEATGIEQSRGVELVLDPAHEGARVGGDSPHTSRPCLRSLGACEDDNVTAAAIRHFRQFGKGARRCALYCLTSQPDGTDRGIGALIAAPCQFLILG